MRNIFTKLKTSATFWSVIGGFILSLVNIVWGEDTVATSVSSAVMFAAPAVAYIVSKFYLRIKMADTNKDGKVSLYELVTALSIAAKETGSETKEVIDVFSKVVEELASKTNDQAALIDHDEVVE